MVNLFSIVTVTLNAGTDLDHTVASVVRQSCKDYEFIVKDGGSTDGSIERLRTRPEAAQIQVIIQKDAGIYWAMNQALLSCRGKYILFLNAGDCFSSDSVLEALRPICVVEDASDLVYTDYWDSRRGIRVLSPRRLDSTFLYRTMLCHQTCFVRRRCYEVWGGFDTRFRVVADYEFLLRLIQRRRGSYRHVDLVSVSMLLGEGFTSRPETVRLGLQEVSQLRREYFTGVRRFVYGGLYRLTLPGIRMRLVSSSRCQPIARRYASLVNWVNRVLYRS